MMRLHKHSSRFLTIHPSLADKQFFLQFYCLSSAGTMQHKTAFRSPLQPKFFAKNSVPYFRRLRGPQRGRAAHGPLLRRVGHAGDDKRHFPTNTFNNLNFFLFPPPVRVSHLRDPPAALRPLRLPLLQEEEERTGE